MEIPSVNRSEEGSGGDGRGYEPIKKNLKQQIEEGEKEHNNNQKKDFAEVTNPKEAILKLLRERILHNARLSEGFVKIVRSYVPQDLPNVEDFKAWADLIINDLNLIFSLIKKSKGYMVAKDAINQAFQLGVKEVFEIIEDIKENDKKGFEEIIGKVIETITERLTKNLV